MTTGRATSAPAGRGDAPADPPTAMDNATGKRLYSVPVPPVIGHASNTQGARMYVVDEHGRVACIEPTR